MADNEITPGDEPIQEPSGMDGGDIGDFAFDGDVVPDDIEQNPKNPQNADENTIQVPKEEWESIRAATAEFERQRAYNSTVEAIKSEIPDFDASKVVDRLKEIHKKDPQKAEAYNSEIGFKLLWREMNEGVAKNDPINGGSNKSGGNDFHSAMDSAMKGEDGALKKALALAV